MEQANAFLKGGYIMTQMEIMRLAGDIIFPGVFFTEHPEDTASAVAALIGTTDDDAAVAWAAKTLGLDEIDVFLIGMWDALQLDSRYSMEAAARDMRYVLDWFGDDVEVTEADMCERRHKAADIAWRIAPY